MPRLKQTPLLSGERQQEEDKLLSLMRRLGIEALPAHETKLVPLARITVPGASLITRPARLVKSIQRVGVLQPPAVVLLTGTSTEDPDATFEVVLGRRRVLAAHLAGLTVIKCEVYESSTPQLSALLALIENEQRSSAWIKEVEDLRRLIDEKVGMTLDDLAEFGFDRGTLAERLKIALLPEPILAQIAAGRMSQDVARKIARLSPSQQARLAEVAVAEEELTAEIVKATLRRCVNAGLAPLQAALGQSWMKGPVSNGDQPPPLWEDEPPAVVPFAALTPAQVRDLLAQFEPMASADPALSRVATLVKVLLKELDIALRTSNSAGG